MCTTKVNAMPDSSHHDAVRIRGQSDDDNDDHDGYLKMAHMQVVSPTLYVEEEKRLAGLESEDNEDESGATKKKKKKKKKRKNVPLEGVLDVNKHSTSKKQKKQNGQAITQETCQASNDDVKPSISKKQKTQIDHPNSNQQTLKACNIDVKPSTSKKQNGQSSNNQQTLKDSDIDVKPSTSKKQKKQNGHTKNQQTLMKASDVDVKEVDAHNTQNDCVKIEDEDVKPLKKHKSQIGGSVYREGMSLSEALQAKHEAKKQSKTSKWRKNRPIEKGVNRRKARLEEKLKALKAKCEVLKARKNLGESVMRQEKRLMSKERKLSSELGFISGSKKERKRKLQEKRMTLAEGLKSPHNPAPILNSHGKPVKSKFDFSIFSMGNDKSRTSDFHGRDYKKLLERVEKRQEEVEVMKEKDVERGRKLEEKMAWQAMMSRARGEKVKDDPKMLKRSLKMKNKMKEKRKRKWEERTAKVEEAKESRQKKRQANLDKRKSDKLEKKKKRAIKKGRYIPGFG